MKHDIFLTNSETGGVDDGGCEWWGQNHVDWQTGAQILG